MQNLFWKYVTKESCNDFLLSLKLLDNNWSDNQKLACLYTVSNNIESHYHEINIPKRNGSIRTLHVPDYLLKEIQTNILKNILYQYPISKYATAYCKHSSIIKNAKPHLQKHIILKLDIKDFFEHITFDKVKELVFKNIIYPPAIQQILTELCCYKGCISQGAPTSAAISNLIMKEIDENIGAWCEERNIAYTRYCDDFTFSGNFSKDEVIKKVKQELNMLHFKLNSNKTKILYLHQRQIITCIVVNRKLQTPKTYRKKIRQELYYIKLYGIEEHLKRINKPITKQEYIHSLLGKINFVLSIQPNDKEFIEYKNWIKRNRNIK